MCFRVLKEGSLKLVGFTYSGGEHPRNFSIHPSGSWVLVANQDSDDVVVFKRDRRTGALEQCHSIEMKQARCIVWGNGQRGKRQPTWHQVADLVPEQKGVNLYVKVAAGRNRADQRNAWKRHGTPCISMRFVRSKWSKSHFLKWCSGTAAVLSPYDPESNNWSFVRKA